VPHGKHARSQTAFRLTKTLREWLPVQAEHEGRTMTAIVEDALEAYKAGRIVPLLPDDQDQGT
jgi:predicted DNA-binding protein